MTKVMTIEEAAKYFNVSKEAIHNRIRRGSLTAEVKDGIKYVHIDTKHHKTVQQKSIKNSLHVESRFNSYLETQNKELLEKIEKLENETRKLREEKEQLLIQERERIEQIYKEKDEQLKNILNAISSKFLLEAKPIDEHEDHFEAEIEETPASKGQTIISLKKYLKQHKLSPKKQEKILKRIKKIAKKDPRFLIEDKKIYLDIQTYTYEDIF